MPSSAYVCYQISGTGNVGPKAHANPTLDSLHNQKPAGRPASTSFILVDPSNPNSKGSGRDARSSIRKHASKACAAQRLATIAERKRSKNTLSKSERRQQEASQRLEAALQLHARKFASIKEEYAEIQDASPVLSIHGAIHGRGHGNNTPSAGYETVTSSYERGRQKCSIPWLLTTSGSLPASTEKTSPESATSCSQIEQHLPIGPSPSPFKVHLSRTDPLAYSSLAFEVDAQVRSLLDSFFGSFFPLLDLRLPMKADRSSQTRYPWSVDVPRLVLSSEPLFWTMVLCAGSFQAVRTQDEPGEVASNLRYRHFAISSVNKRLQAPEKDIFLDFALISAISSLGTWERLHGSKEIWHTHCKGVRMLSERMMERNQHQLLSHFIAESQASDSQLWADNHTEGFKGMRRKVTLDRLLVSAICRCPLSEEFELNEAQQQTLQAEAKEILKYSSASATCGRVPGAAYDRIGLEMHVLIQGAGVSMINFVKKHTVINGLDQIDFPELCREAVDLTTSVSSIPSYDDLLLWASFTVFSLNSYNDRDWMKIVATVARRALITNWPDMVNLLRTFVYVEAAAMTYQEAWCMVEPHLEFER